MRFIPSSQNLRRALAVALIPATIGAANPALTVEERLVSAHNGERAALGLPLLRWNADLATDAQGWAHRLASTGRFEHAPQGIRPDQGENLWAGTRGYFEPEAMVAAWAREKRHFRPGVFPHNSVTGNVSDVGHYTQMVWRETHEVGCALASGRREDVLVCRYAQPGNFIGERPY